MDLSKLPADLPLPVDDGRCNHLTGLMLPAISLLSTDGDYLSLAKLPVLTVIYIYPMTGHPDKNLPSGWDAIAGARGCTPQACGFRDHFAELAGFGAAVYGLSSQSHRQQTEAVARLHLPYPLLSDADLLFASRLELPTFEVEGRRFIKRLTLICRRQQIEKVFYPVFPPDQNAAEVINYLRNIVT